MLPGKAFRGLKYPRFSTDRFFITGTGGTVTKQGSISTGSKLWAIAVDPAGKYVYATNYNDGNVSQYSIGTTGLLTSLGTLPCGPSPGNGPGHIPGPAKKPG